MGGAAADVSARRDSCGEMVPAKEVLAVQSSLLCVNSGGKCSVFALETASSYATDRETS